MIVDETGKVTHPHIVNSVSPSLDAEAIRVVSRMPQWVPGKQTRRDGKGSVFTAHCLQTTKARSRTD